MDVVEVKVETECYELRQVLECERERLGTSFRDIVEVQIDIERFEFLQVVERTRQFPGSLSSELVRVQVELEADEVCGLFDEITQDASALLRCPSRYKDKLEMLELGT